MNLAHISAETLRILDAGHYDVDGKRVEFGDSVQIACDSARLYDPSELKRLVSSTFATGQRAGRVCVTNESTIQCARRLYDTHRQPPACLNFASGRNAGGGFLGNARAQEEMVCRASGLYPTLRRHPRYYDENRRADTRYTDWAIVSPNVPVFRDDRLRLTPEVSQAHFVTMPAPNAGALRNPQADDLRLIFERRIEFVLALMTHLGSERIVLGAWGCGAFRNDPRLVANAFRDVLSRGWARNFEEVIFAIIDRRVSDGQRGAGNLEVFQRVLYGEA